MANPAAAEQGEEITLSIQLVRSGPSLTETVRLTDTLPAGLSYIPGTLTATSGTVDETLAPVLHWTGFLADLTTVEISYRAIVVEQATASLLSDTVVDAGRAGRLNLIFTVVANGLKTYFPAMDHDHIPEDDPELPLP
jgi:uncharacterized repeat protein (TIGR01451 family)